MLCDLWEGLPKKSFFIVIEGIDQSGKETQSELLRKRFEKEGYKSIVISFPNYKTKKLVSKRNPH